MIAVLKYTDCLQDGRTVFSVLASNNVEILKTQQGASIYPKITIKIKDNIELNSLLYRLNNCCRYEVRVVKIKSENSLFSKIKRLFT